MQGLLRWLIRLYWNTFRDEEIIPLSVLGQDMWADLPIAKQVAHELEKHRLYTLQRRGFELTPDEKRVLRLPEDEESN